ncbi:MAG: SirB1 family protein [Dehalococcoidia bacterium]
MEPTLAREFEAAIAGKDHEVDLFGAAVILARIRDDNVDGHACARELDLIAEAVVDDVGGRGDTEALASAIDHELFTVRGFQGAREEMDDPRNSCIDQVLQRRRGLPILLSLVYMEVAQRVGLPCDGIGYPGHFIVRYGEPGNPRYVDPFHQGARLDREELLAGLRGQPLGGATPESFLAGVTRRQFIQRMLNNLRAAYRVHRDISRWLDTVELQIRLEPWNASLVGERGMLRYRLGQHHLALHDLERYVGASERETAHRGAVRLLDELRLRLEREGEN